ncbi:MAG: hypothetical protein K8F24_09065, partial [Bacteroidales bacterium]|nr:hypothetical protein [Bacteroidales bacterium]
MTAILLSNEKHPADALLLSTEDKYNYCTFFNSAASYFFRLMQKIDVTNHVSNEVAYYDAEQEKGMCVAQANTLLKKNGEFANEQISARQSFNPASVHESQVTHIDVSPQQIVSLSTSLISFLEHDDNTRALMGSNMQRQAVPIIKPAASLVGTGIEDIAASEQCVRAPEDGTVKSVDANKLVFVGKSGKKYEYTIETFVRTNQSTCHHQRPVVDAGNEIKKDAPMIDGTSVDHGEIALGQNLLVSYQAWSGYNYEDAIIISDRIVRDGTFNSIHIEEY